MSEFDLEAKKLIVQDLSAFFNAATNFCIKEQQNLSAMYRRQSFAELMPQVNRDLVRLVEFHTDAQIVGSLPTNNIGSTELAAIETIRALENAVGLGSAVPVMYKTMKELAEVNKFEFKPVYPGAKL